MVSKFLPTWKIWEKQQSPYLFRKLNNLFYLHNDEGYNGPVDFLTCVEAYSNKIHVYLYTYEEIYVEWIALPVGKSMYADTWLRQVLRKMKKWDVDLTVPLEFKMQMPKPKLHKWG